MNVEIRYSVNLVDWFDLGVTPSLQSSDGVEEVWLYHDPAGIGGGGRRFYRVVLDDL